MFGVRFKVCVRLSKVFGGLLTVFCRITPDNAITELTWRPMVGPEKSREKSSRDLAVASEDASVRIYTVPL